MTEQAPPEAIEAMTALVERMAKGYNLPFVNENNIDPYTAQAEARRIAAMLPKPVDPAVLACREIGIKHALPAICSDMSSYAARRGDGDSDMWMLALLAAYRAGAATKEEG